MYTVARRPKHFSWSVLMGVGWLAGDPGGVVLPDRIKWVMGLLWRWGGGMEQRCLVCWRILGNRKIGFGSFFLDVHYKNSRNFLALKVRMENRKRKTRIRATLLFTAPKTAQQRLWKIRKLCTIWLVFWNNVYFSLRIQFSFGSVYYSRIYI